MISQQRLKELVHYDPLTGKFKRLVTTSPTALKGSKLGTKNRYGNLVAVLDGTQYQLTHLARIYVVGSVPSKCRFAFEDQDKTNLRFNNLCFAGAEKFRILSSNPTPKPKPKPIHDNEYKPRGLYKGPVLASIDVKPRNFGHLPPPLKPKL